MHKKLKSKIAKINGKSIFITKRYGYRIHDRDVATLGYVAQETRHFEYVMLLWPIGAPDREQVGGYYVYIVMKIRKRLSISEG